jgi:hypothetical protein
VSAASTTTSPGAGQPLQLGRWNGGRNWVVAGGGAGLLFLLLTAVGLAISPREAFFSYLVAFAYWCGIAMGSIVLLMIMHATKARWVTVVRRPLEVMSASIAVFILLAIPVLVGMKQLYIWMDPPASLGKEALAALKHKGPYLNQGFFVLRLGIYFLLWIFLAERLFGWSKRQDVSGDINLLQRQRSLGAGGLPFIALTFSFAAFDWLMSLNPLWFSTIFGVYYFAGSFVAALSLWAIVTRGSHAREDKDSYVSYMTVEHTHNIGKLMLAFVCFWTYIAFSQLMLIWIAGLPEETPFYITRFGRGWAGVGILLIFGHFFLPFGALLSRSLKRDPRKLAVVAAWIMFVHYVDIYWLVIPTLHPEGFHLHWTAVTAFLGVGLIAIAFAVSRLRGQFAVPVKDPYLGESLRYRQP